jgi:hypothetical protein
MDAGLGVGLSYLLLSFCVLSICSFVGFSSKRQFFRGKKRKERYKNWTVF